jgi:hypothetical protein
VYEIKFRKIQIFYILKANTHRWFLVAERLRDFNCPQYDAVTQTAQGARAVDLQRRL